MIDNIIVYLIILMTLFNIWRFLLSMEQFWWDTFIKEIENNPISCPVERLTKVRELKDVELAPPLDGIGDMASYVSLETGSYYAKMFKPDTLEVIWIGGKVPTKLRVLYKILRLAGTK